MYFLLAFSLHSETYAKLVIIIKVIKSPISSTSLFCAIIISKEVIIVKKDIDFDKISEEVLTEFLASIKTDNEEAKMQIENIAMISSHICSLMFAKYHQELLKD